MQWIGDDMTAGDNAVITIMDASSEAGVVDKLLKSPQVELNISSAEAVEKLLDDITWKPIHDRLMSYIKKGAVSGGILIHPGTTFTKKLRGQHPYGNKGITPQDKHKVRTETCLALRLLNVTAELVLHERPVAVLMPTSSSDAVSLLALNEWKELGSKLISYTIGTVTVITNISTKPRTLSQLVAGFDLGVHRKSMQSSLPSSQ